MPTTILSQSLRFIFATFFVWAGVLLFGNEASAASYYWVGNSDNFESNGNWNSIDATCGTAGNGVIPTSTDTVIFGNLCDQSVTITSGSPRTFTGITFESGYTGTVTLAGTTVVNGSVTIVSGATLVAGSNTLALTGNWSNAGTYTTSGTTRFNASSGAQTIDTGGTGAGKTFSTLQIDNSSSGVSIVTNHLTTTDLTISSGAIFDAVAQNLVVSGSLSNSGTLKLTGSQTFTVGTSDLDSGTIVYNGTSDYASVTPIATYYNLTFASSDSAAASWAFNALLDVNGALTITAGTVTLGANSNDVDGLVTLGDDTDAVLDVSASNYSLSVGAGWTDTGSGSFTERSGTVTFDGTGTINSNDNFYNVTVNASGSTITLSALSTGIDGALTVTNGTFLLGAALDVDGAVTVASASTAILNIVTYQLNVGGNWTVGSSGVFTAGSGSTVVLDSGTTRTITTGGANTNHDFHHLTVTGTSTNVTVATDALEVDGTLTITGTNAWLSTDGNALTAATLDNTATLIVDGSEVVTITSMDTNSGTVAYDGGTGTVSYSELVAGASYYHLLIQGTSDTFTIDENISVAGNLTISSGSTLAGATYTITTTGNCVIAGTYTASSSTLSCGGDFTRTGTFTAGTGTVTFSGSSNHTASGATTFYNLTKTGTGTLSLTAGQTFTVSGTFTATNTSSTLNSTSAGTTATLAATGTTNVNTLTVQDIVNTGANIRCYPLCTNGGNNTGWLFTAASSVVTGGGGGSSMTTLAVTAPNGGEALVGGSVAEVKWISTGSMNSMTIEYSKDGGNTYAIVASGESNDGSYSWTVPNESVSMAKVQIKGYSDGALAFTDISDANFRITASASTPSATTPTNQEPTGTTTVSMRKSDGTMVNLVAGNLFRGVTLSGVYRVNADGTRSVFPNEAAFFSYETDFSRVMTMADDQLQKLPLGKRIAMNKGSLVKIQSNPKVYVVGEGSVLTWISSEASAKQQFGNDWASKVRDVSDAFWGDYTL